MSDESSDEFVQPLPKLEKKKTSQKKKTSSSKKIEEQLLLTPDMTLVPSKSKKKSDKYEKVRYEEDKLSRKHIEQLVDLVTRNTLSLFKAPTGMGKTTNGILALHLVFGARVFCTQPTILSVNEAAGYMRERYPDVSIGTASDGNIKYDDKTQVVYCTYGHLFNRIIECLKEGRITGKYDIGFDVLALDEAHNGSVLSDTILNAWLYLAEKVKNLDDKEGSSVPRMLLISATIDDSSFPSLKGMLNKDNILIIEEATYPVKIEYLDHDYYPNEKEIYAEMADILYQRYLSEEIDEKRVLKWLAICPGKSEIAAITKVLKEKLKVQIEKEELFIVEVYSGKHENEGDITHRTELKPGQLMMVIATPVFESSLTLDNCQLVLDSMREKIIETTENGSNRLVVVEESKSSAVQRKGRTGRVVKDGICIRMCTEEHYDKLPDSRAAELYRLNLANVFLQIFKTGIQPQELYKYQKLPKERIDQAISILLYLELIKIREMEVGDEYLTYNITEKGIFVSKFELSVKGGSLLWDWIQEEYPIYPGIVAICLLEFSVNPSYFYYPGRKPEMTTQEYNQFKKEYYRQYFKTFETNENGVEAKSMLGIFLNLWEQFSLKFKTLKITGPLVGKVKDWARENSLNNKTFNECVKYILAFSQRLVGMGYEVKTGDFNGANVEKAITPLLSKSYGNMIFTAIAGKRNMFRDKEGNTMMLNNNLPDIVLKNTGNNIVVLGLFSTGMKTFVTLFMPFIRK